MKAAPFTYQRAGTAAEAVALLTAAGDGAKVCSGSQSLGPMLNLRLAQVEQLIDLRTVPALQAFELQPQVLRIGAAVTHARIEDGALPDCTQGLLPAVAAHIAYRAVRNRGTIGGSLAHADPAADWVSVMCLLDASVLLLGPAGERRLPVRDFFIGPFTTALAADEIVLAVEVPRFSADARWAWRKVCRKPGEFADAIGAAWVDPARGVTRVLMGALSSMPFVAEGSDVLAALQDPARAPATQQRLLDDAGVDDPYEREVHAEMLRRAVADLQTPPRSRP